MVGFYVTTCQKCQHFLWESPYCAYPISFFVLPHTSPALTVSKKMLNLVNFWSNTEWLIQCTVLPLVSRLGGLRKISFHSWYPHAFTHEFAFSPYVNGGQMLLHRCNSTCITLRDPLCRADSQGRRWTAGGHGVSTYLGHPHSDYGAQTVAAGDIRTRSVSFSAVLCKLAEDGEDVRRRLKHGGAE